MNFVSRVCFARKKVLHRNRKCFILPLQVDRIPPLGDAGPGLHWKFSESTQATSLCLADQGYGSERSPEEEYPPSLPGEHHLQCHRHLEPHACYPFITPGKIK